MSQLKPLYKIVFHFTEKTTFTAQAYRYHVGLKFEYSNETVKDGISVHQNVEVPFDDVLYIEVHQFDTGIVSIIPGLIRKFNVHPDKRQLNAIDAEIKETQTRNANFAKRRAKKRANLMAKVRAGRKLKHVLKQPKSK